MLRPLRLTIIRLGTLACVAASLAGAQPPVDMAPNAPRDRPASISEICQWKALSKAIEPLVQHARATYPAAKQRFIAGLPAREHFFVVARLADSLGHQEQVFVVVDSVAGDRIAGRIWSHISLVRGYQLRQPYELREGDIIDWLISKSDGTEEGNEVGKFIETYHMPTTCRDRAGRGKDCQ